MENQIGNNVETVGEMLKNTRLKSGKTLSDVANDLCIRKVYLNAIEEMDFDNIPEMPYGLGFIRTYAQYLGLNSDRIVASYRQLDAEGNAGKLADEDENTAVSKPNFKHIFFSIIGLIAIIGAGLTLSTRQNYENVDDQQMEDVVIAEPNIVDEPQIKEYEVKSEETKTDLTDENTYSENAETSAAEEIKDALDADVASAQDEIKATPQGLRFVLTGPSWIELRQGDKIILQGIYNKDFSYDIENVADTYITVGRHYYAQFYRGDKLIKIVSAMKKKNVKLDEYLNNQE